MTPTVYPETEAPLLGAPSTLHVFLVNGIVATWRARHYQGPDSEGSIDKSGKWGYPLVFGTPVQATKFREKHLRALPDAVLVAISDTELMRRNHHQVSAAGVKFVPTIRAAAFLQLTPEQQAGPEGREVLR